MTYAAAVLADNPLASWSLNEGASYGWYYDRTPAARNAYGYVTLPGYPGLVRSERNGKSVYFDGSSGAGRYISAANTANAWNVDTFTVEAWYQPITISTNVFPAIVTRGDPNYSGTNQVWGVFQYGTQLYIYIWNASGQASSWTFPANFATGVKCHIAVTYDGANVRAFKNGVQIGTDQAFATTLPKPTGTPITIGLTHQLTNSYRGYGYIDEAAFYGTALAQARLLAHYDAGMADPPPQVKTSVVRDITSQIAVDLTVLRTKRLALSILYPEQAFVPTTLTVALAGGHANTPVTFRVDGNLIGQLIADNNGALAPTALPIPNVLDGSGTPRFGAGTHTVTAVQNDAVPASAEFTLAEDPYQTPVPIGADAAPSDVAGAIRNNGTRRWILQDKMPGGLGSWVMPLNPVESSPPPFERFLQVRKTINAQTPRYHVFEGAPMPVEWTFSGYAPNLEMADKLAQFGDLKRRFYIIDHRRRAWVVTFVNVELVPRLVQWWNGVETKEGHDYTVQAMVYGRDWVEVSA